MNHTRLLFLLQHFKDERFLEEFAHENVTFLPLAEELTKSRFETWLFFFHKHLIYTGHVRFMDKWGLGGRIRYDAPNRLGYYIKRAVFSVLKHIRILRDFTRYLDFVVFQKKEIAEFQNILREIQPSLVFVTHITSDREVALVKAAKKEGILSVGLPKSWDNLSKNGVRAKPDRIVVWNDFMVGQCITNQNYKKEEVYKFGVPQFDMCAEDERRMSREEFCALHGLDPKRKLIVFGSEGKLIPTDANTSQIVADFIHADALPYEAQMLIRPHYGYKNDEQKFAALVDTEHIAIDTLNNPSLCFRDEWDYSTEFTNRFYNTLYHADVLITTASTLTLDAACFGTQTVCIAFDGEEVLPYSRSVARWYETDYYQEVLSHGATDRVYSKEELQDALGTILTDPEYKKDELMALQRSMCGEIDGGSGERLFAIVEKSCSRVYNQIVVHIVVSKV